MIDGASKMLLPLYGTSRSLFSSRRVSQWRGQLRGRTALSTIERVSLCAPLHVSPRNSLSKSALHGSTALEWCLPRLPLRGLCPFERYLLGLHLLNLRPVRPLVYPVSLAVATPLPAWEAFVGRSDL